MKTYKFIALVLTSFLAIPPFGHSADESSDPDTFISLTRRPTSVDRLPSNISVVTQEEIKQSGALTLDQVLRLQPSIHVNATGGTGSFSTAKIRGVPSSAQEQIMIDDQPYAGISNQFLDFSLIPVRDIERIEIVRGGSSVLYGPNTTGGVIHVFTKKRPAGDKELRLDYEYGSLNTNVANFEAGANIGKTDMTVFAQSLTTDGYQQNSDANNKYVSANLGQSFNSGGRVALHIANLDSSVGVPQGTSVPISQWDGHKERVTSNPTNQADQNRFEGRFKIEQPLSSFGMFQTSFFGSNSNYLNHSSAGPFDGNLDKDEQVIGNDTRFIFQQGTTLGASYERDHNSSNYIDPFSGPVLTEAVIKDVGGYIEQDIHNQKVSFIPALRYDHHSNFGSEYNPRLTMAYHLVDSWTMSGNISRAFRAPSYSELYSDFPPTGFVANRNLKPEISWTYDFGNQFKINENQKINLTGFYTKINDRIATIDPDNDGFLNNTNANISKAELEGVEFEHNGVMGPFFDRANYTYQRSLETSVSSTQFVPIALTPEHLANVVLGYQNKRGTTLTTNWQYVSKQYENDNKKGRQLPSYGLWGFKFSQQLNRVGLYFGVNNILEKRYSEAFDFDTVNSVNTLNPMPGRTYYGGLNFHF